jgi:hypothetical protein
MPINFAAVRAADESRKIGHQKLASDQNEFKKLELIAGKIETVSSQSAQIIDLMARETGLEPATSGVTGRRSNQLSYSPAAVRGDWTERRSAG